jgi:hypothetical protein
MTVRRKEDPQLKYAGFISLVEGVAEELYPGASKVADENPLALDCLSHIYDTAFERNPDAFKGIQSIDSEYGLPAWVRPGVEWEPA